MKDRILQFLSAEKISPAEFADKIGVQRSSMSHILNGRNYPSATFIQKMLQSYPFLNPRWLMIGDGNMNSGRESNQLHNPIEEDAGSAAKIANEKPHYQVSQNDGNENIPFSIPAAIGITTELPESENQVKFQENAGRIAYSAINESEKGSESATPLTSIPSTAPQSELKDIEQIIVIYKDKTFTSYRPS